MKIYSLRILFFMGIVFAWNVYASWSDDFCVENDKNCAELSNDSKWPYCVESSNMFGTTCAMNSLTNNLSSFMTWNNTNIPLGKMAQKDLIQNYCFSLLWDSSSWRVYYAKPSSVIDSWDRQQTFDSHQSIFVYALCASFKGEDGKKMPFLKDDYLWWIFKDEDIAKALKLRQKVEWRDNCSIADNPYINNCDMSIYATEIYSNIMSDIFKIKYAQVLNLNDSKNVKYDENVESFMKWYYGFDEKYSQLKKEFPKSVDVLKSNQKQYKKILDNLKIIDNSKLSDNATKTGCPKKWNMTWVNFIACALHSSQAKWSALTPSFVTMIYNEIFHYQIFWIYMKYWAEKRVDEMKTEDLKTIGEYRYKALDFQWYLNLQIQATKQALNSFEDFNMTYPLHIWLLMYQEKIKAFRDKGLSPIVTLFYSLSEKLQNVQLPQ